MGLQGWHSKQYAIKQTFLIEQVERSLGADGKVLFWCTPSFVLPGHHPCKLVSLPICNQSVMVRQPMSVALDENIMDRFVGLVRFAWDT